MAGNRPEQGTRKRLSGTLRLLRALTQETIGDAGRLLRRAGSPDLNERDSRQLASQIETALDDNLGPVISRAEAAEVAAAYRTLDAVGRHRFFVMLAAEFGVARASVDRAAAAYEARSSRLARTGEQTDADLDDAEKSLRDALIPAWERLFRLFVGTDGGVKFAVDLRADLLDVIASIRTGPDPVPSTGGARNPELARLNRVDTDLARLLTEIFDVGLLELRQITWESPAALLEKLIAYEAVHEITSWADLKHRLRADRRCFAFVQPAMPDEPLIFVEVALTEELPGEIAPLLDQQSPVANAASMNWAIFYSISACQPGLAGVNLGDFLIKRVVSDLRRELPTLKSFATLSPIPGLRAWLEAHIDDPSESLLDGFSETALEQLRHLAEPHSDSPIDGVRRLLTDTSWTTDPVLTEAAGGALRGLAARFLVHAKRSGRAADRVANFHLTNGARIERIDPNANMSSTGVRESLGVMVNYRYDLGRIADNHVAYVVDGDIATSSTVSRLAG